MKDYKLLTLFISLLLLSCANPVDLALDYAGNNRKELEKVLDYFEAKGDETALQAAEFIITNMPGHKSMYGCYAEYYNEVDSLFSEGLNADDAYGAINMVSDSYGNTIGYDYDSHIISSEYLIKDIETAVSQWTQGQWATHLDFDEFCEWLLPYTCSSSQPLDDWRSNLESFAKGYIDELYVCDSPSHSCKTGFPHPDFSPRNRSPLIIVKDSNVCVFAR